MAGCNLALSESLLVAIKWHEMGRIRTAGSSLRYHQTVVFTGLLGLGFSQCMIPATTTTTTTTATTTITSTNQAETKALNMPTCPILFFRLMLPLVPFTAAALPR